MQIVSFTPPEGARLVVTDQPAAPMTYSIPAEVTINERWLGKIQAFLAEQWGIAPAAVVVNVSVQ
jgi:hypothetical protein